MAANDKQATLEPIQFDDKSGLATFFQFIGIIVWCVGAVGVVFAVLAYMGIGSFIEIFDMVLPEGLSVPTIVMMGLAVFFIGLPMLAIAEIIRLLKRSATTIYAVRGLDSMIPKTMSVEGFSMEALQEMNRANSDKTETEEEPENEKGRVTAVKKAGDGANIQITVNVGGQGNDALSEKLPVTVMTGSDTEKAKTVEADSKEQENGLLSEKLPVQELVETASENS